MSHQQENNNRGRRNNNNNNNNSSYGNKTFRSEGGSGGRFGNRERANSDPEAAGNNRFQDNKFFSRSSTGRRDSSPGDQDNNNSSRRRPLPGSQDVRLTEGSGHSRPQRSYNNREEGGNSFSQQRGNNNDRRGGSGSYDHRDHREGDHRGERRDRTGSGENFHRGGGERGGDRDYRGGGGGDRGDTRGGFRYQDRDQQDSRYNNNNNNRFNTNNNNNSNNNNNNNNDSTRPTRINAPDFFHLSSEEIRDVCSNDEEVLIKSYKGELIYKTLLVQLLGDRVFRGVGNDRRKVLLHHTRYNSLFILSIFLNQGTNFRGLFPDFGGRHPDHYGLLVFALLYESGVVNDHGNSNNGREPTLVNLSPWFNVARSIKEWIDTHVNFERTFPSVDGKEIVWKTGAAGDVKWRESILHEYQYASPATATTMTNTTAAAAPTSTSRTVEHTGEERRDFRSSSLNYGGRGEERSAPAVNGRGPGGGRAPTDRDDGHQQQQQRGGGRNQRDNNNNNQVREDRPPREPREPREPRHPNNNSNNNNNQGDEKPERQPRNNNRRGGAEKGPSTTITAATTPSTGLPIVVNDPSHLVHKITEPKALPSIAFRNIVDLSAKMNSVLTKEAKIYTEKYGNTLNFTPQAQAGHVWNELRLHDNTLTGQTTNLTWTGTQCIHCDAFLARCKVNKKFWNLFILGLTECPKKRGSEWIGPYQRRLTNKVAEVGDEFFDDKITTRELREWGFVSAAEEAEEGK